MGVDSAIRSQKPCVIKGFMKALIGEAAKPYMVRLYKHQRNAIKRIAKKERISDAQMVRNAIDKYATAEAT